METSEILAAYWKCFHNPEGHIVLVDLKNLFFNSLMVSEDCNPNQLLFREGRRAVVLHILAQIEEFEIQEEQKRLDKPPEGETDNG